MGSEYLTLADDDILQNLNQNDYGIIDEIQGKVRDTIKDFLRRDRRIDETEEDFGVKDYSILIEGYMAGFTSYEHKLDIQSKGDASLMRHVVAMT